MIRKLINLFLVIVVITAAWLIIVNLVAIVWWLTTPMVSVWKKI